MSKSKNQSSIILKLNIDNDDVAKNKKEIKLDEISENSSEEELDDSICKKCSKYEKQIKSYKEKLDIMSKRERSDKKYRVHEHQLNIYSVTNGKKISLKDTSIKCFWDSNPINGPPFPLPETYWNNEYHVLSVLFCSPNCALAHNLFHIKDNKIDTRKSLVYQLYYELCGLKIENTKEIKEAPPRELLKDFGGKMTIDEYRDCLNLINNEYIKLMPPIKTLITNIEERNINNSLTHNDNKYILKRAKNRNNKNAMMASLGVKIN